MTRPRQVSPGDVVFCTRRCTRRQFLLRPDPDTCQILEYCLAYCAAKYRIELHEFVVMSNHYHLVLSDPLGNRPDFFRDLNKDFPSQDFPSQGPSGIFDGCLATLLYREHLSFPSQGLFEHLEIETLRSKAPRTPREVAAQEKALAMAPPITDPVSTISGLSVHKRLIPIVK